MSIGVSPGERPLYSFLGVLVAAVSAVVAAFMAIPAIRFVFYPVPHAPVRERRVSVRHFW